jgi:hypothetical protein
MRLTPLRVVRYFSVRRLLLFLLHLPNFVKLFSRLPTDPRIAPRAKLLPMAVLAYLILSADLFTDVMPGFDKSTIWPSLYWGYWGSDCFCAYARLK